MPPFKAAILSAVTLFLTDYDALEGTDEEEFKVYEATMAGCVVFLSTMYSVDPLSYKKIVVALEAELEAEVSGSNKQVIMLLKKCMLKKAVTNGR